MNAQTKITIGGRLWRQIFLLIAITSHLAMAQEAAVEWVRQIRTTDDVFVQRITADASGNVYVTGIFEGSLNFGTTNVAAIGEENGFLAKFDTHSDLKWVRTVTGPHSWPRDLVLTPAGEVCILGTFSEQADFGTRILRKTAGRDWFVAKYGLGGGLISAIQGGGIGDAAGLQMANDRNGSLYLQILASSEFFVTKISPEGNRSWTEAGGDSALVCDEAGNTLSVGFHPPTQKCFLQKRSASGDLQWRTDNLPRLLLCAASDGTGGFWVGGQLQDNFTHAGTTYRGNGFGIPSPWILLRIAANGEIAQISVGDTFSSVSGIATNSSGVFVNGFSGDSSFLSKVGKNGVETVLGRIAQVPSRNSGSFGGGLGVDAEENCYMTAPIYDRASIGSQILTNSGGSGDFLVAKYRTAPLLFRMHPESKVALVNGQAMFSVETVSSIAPTFQWRHNGTNVPSATISSLSLSGIRPEHAGDYNVVVSVNTHSLTSRVATLVVNYPPTATILTPLGDVTILTGGSVDFEVEAGDHLGAITNVALLVGSEIVGNVAAPPYRFRRAFVQDGSYTIVARATDNYGFSEDSTPIRILVGRPPVISRAPATQTAPSGATVSFSVGAQGTAPFQYSWHGPTGAAAGDRSTLTLTNVSAAHSGSYGVTVSNLWGGVSQSASLLVTNRTAPFVTIIADGTPLSGGTHVFADKTIVTLSGYFANGQVFYTLGGSPVDFDAQIYDGPITLNGSATLRAAVYSEDFALRGEAQAVEFVRSPTSFLLEATSAGGGAITLQPASARYASNQVVRAQAAPSLGWTFLRWTGDSIETETEIDIAMTRSKSLRAHFGTTLSTSVSGAGDLHVRPGAELFPFGTPVTITAIPQPGAYFVRWGGTATGTQSSLTITVTNATPRITSLFGTLPEGEATITVLTAGGGTVEIEPHKNKYRVGEAVTLRAIPEDEQRFVAWGGAASGAQATITRLVTESLIVTAEFSDTARFSIRASELVDSRALIVRLEGPLGERMQISAAEDMSEWRPFLTVTNTAGVFEFVQPLTDSVPRRFFKLP